MNKFRKDIAPAMEDGNAQKSNSTPHGNRMTNRNKIGLKTAAKKFQPRPPKCSMCLHLNWIRIIFLESATILKQ